MGRRGHKGKWPSAVAFVDAFDQCAEHPGSPSAIHRNMFERGNRRRLYGNAQIAARNSRGDRP